MVLDERQLMVGWILLALVSAIVIGVGTADARLPADIEVADTSCADGAIYAIDVRVQYHGDAPVRVTAHVWSSRSHVQLAWAPTRVQVMPGEQVLQFRAPRERAAIGGDRAQLALNAGQQRAIVNWGPDSCR